MDATREQRLDQLDLRTVVRTYTTEEGTGDDEGDVRAARRDLVVAEVRRGELGWVVYGRPLTRPDSGQRTRVQVNGSVEVVAGESDLAEIRQVLADHLRRPPGPDVRLDASEAHPPGNVDVNAVGPDALILRVSVCGTQWRVVL